MIQAHKTPEQWHAIYEQAKLDHRNKSIKESHLINFKELIYFISDCIKKHPPEEEVEKAAMLRLTEVIYHKFQKQ